MGFIFASSFKALCVRPRQVPFESSNEVVHKFIESDTQCQSCGSFHTYLKKAHRSEIPCALSIQRCRASLNHCRDALNLMLSGLGVE